MDIEAVLARARQAATDQELAEDDHSAAVAGWDLAEAFMALDDWLRRGGFLPRDWAASVTTTRALLAKREA